ncbi:MAG: DUF484 family protein [Alphaproteobacteria bacterium]|nr:MAG: DUF484 family protein [Alphaproteobacteria bacterium]TAF37845.1 MAG: DUF484 family protein [Alphaproteobacteria bacterium]TAF75276.1 MAG: DUF484 family protein [Alphaproteobacteria bacterium]
MDSDRTICESDLPLASYVSAEEVVHYLTHHPDFLHDHPELWERLTPPSRLTSESPHTIADFQQHAIRHLQQQMQHLRTEHGGMVRIVREQQQIMKRMQRAIAACVRISTLEDMFEMLCMELPVLLHIDVVRLGLESDMASYYESYYPESNYSGLVLFPLHAHKLYFGQHNIIHSVARDASYAPLHQMLFHECRALADQCIYLRLPLLSIERDAILALGVRADAHMFPTHAESMMIFFAEALSHILDRLLAQDAGLL